MGTEVPIIASLDLHCNLTKKMVKYADAFFPYDYYPHTDTYEAGIRAAKCMWDTLEGRIHPVMAYAFGFSALLYAYRRTIYGKVRGESTEDQQ